MIIADKRKKGIDFKTKRLLGIGILSCFLLGLLFYFGQNLSDSKSEALYFCDAEKRDGDNFIGKGGVFQNGNTYSHEKSFSGKHSCRTGLSSDLTYGFSIDLKELTPGLVYKASVWKYEVELPATGKLVVTGRGDLKLYQVSNTSVKREASGWEKLQLTFTVPESYDGDKKYLNIHVYSPGDKVVFFDDLEIDLHQGYADVPDLESYDLTIEEKNFKKILKKREEAIAAGILVTGNDDWVKGKLIDQKNEEKLKVKLRLKGDWLDHLMGDKWSYRIKVKDPGAWKRLKTFSLQTPAARYFLHEWAFHQLLEKEDILTTRYDFVQLRVNGNPKGIYAYEEHFEKQLVESRNRREGPIVKFSEDGFWGARKNQIRQIGKIIGGDFNPAALENYAPILTFAEGQMTKDSTKKALFETAQNLMFQYATGVKQVSEVFDVDRLAKYIAICEVIQANHGLIWHNQRFYFNPILQKLEPIGFDGFNREPYEKYYFLGMGATNENTGRSHDMVKRLFLDREFTEKYLFYLNKISGSEYLSDFFDSIAVDTEVRLKWLKQEFPKYTFNADRFVELANITNLLIKAYPNSLQVYTQKKSGGSKTVQLATVHHLPLEVLGFGTDEEEMTPLKESVGLDAQSLRNEWVLSTQPKYSDKRFKLNNVRRNAKNALNRHYLRNVKTAEIPVNAKYLFFKVLGTEEILTTKIMDWKSPIDEVPQQEVFDKITVKTNDLFEVKDSVVFFKPGKYKTEKDIVIPQNYKVIFEQGVEIDFVKKSKFISKSPVYTLGTAENPVKILSSDKSAAGFTVLNPNDSCLLNHTIFSGFNTLKYKTWNLTGAVTFHEASVAMNNCRFENNQCEDGLNLIRSDFKMIRCTIKNTFSDGFDADFCKGVIWNSYFENTGNDAMDFSGSVINIHTTKANGCGDKGISVGEQSDVRIIDCKVDKAVIGVASKDLSVAIVENLELGDCETGFAAYQKKPEFGPSKIMITKYKANNLRRLYSAGQGCLIQFPEGEEIIK